MLKFDLKERVDETFVVEEKAYGDVGLVIYMVFPLVAPLCA